MNLKNKIKYYTLQICILGIKEDYFTQQEKINNGFIKNDFNVLQISDRDFLQSNIFNYKKNFF